MVVVVVVVVVGLGRGKGREARRVDQTSKIHIIEPLLNMMSSTRPWMLREAYTKGQGATGELEKIESLLP